MGGAEVADQQEEQGQDQGEGEEDQLKVVAKVFAVGVPAFPVLTVAVSDAALQEKPAGRTKRKFLEPVMAPANDSVMVRLAKLCVGVPATIVGIAPATVLVPRDDVAT